MNNNFKLKNKDKLREWFLLFGTEFGLDELISKKCWEEIDGNCDKVALQSEFTKKV